MLDEPPLLPPPPATLAKSEDDFLVAFKPPIPPPLLIFPLLTPPDIVRVVCLVLLVAESGRDEAGGRVLGCVDVFDDDDHKSDVGCRLEGNGGGCEVEGDELPL